MMFNWCKWFRRFKKPADSTALLSSRGDYFVGYGGLSFPRDEDGTVRVPDYSNVTGETIRFSGGVTGQYLLPADADEEREGIEDTMGKGSLPEEIS